MANQAPPDVLKAIKPYLTLATQLDAKNDKVIAYYCRLYSVQNGMSINKSAPECKKFLLNLMDSLENSKKEIQHDEGVQSSVVGQAYVERHALKLFECADEDDRQSKFTKNLVKQFYSAGLLFDVLNYFGELSEDLVTKKQYAKRKAMYLNKCFQIGETPVPGPLTGEDGEQQSDEFGAAGGSGGGFDHSGQAGPSGYGGGVSPNKNVPYSAPYPPAGSISPGQYNNQLNTGVNKMSINRPGSSSNQEVSNFNTVNEERASYSTTNPEMMVEAQKLCKHASSALQYDDVATAITKLEACLRLLKNGK